MHDQEPDDLEPWVTPLEVARQLPSRASAPEPLTLPTREATSVRLEDLLGDTSTDGAQAAAYLRTLHGHAQGFAVVTGIGTSQVLSVARPPLELADLLESGLDQLVDGELGRCDLYVSVATHTIDPTGTRGRQRGTAATVGWVPAVVLDLDVKDGAFTSEADALAFLARLPIPPTIIIRTGSGGLHAYWILADGPVDAATARAAGHAWWLFCREMADGVALDPVYDPARMLRLPGSVRWPKPPVHQARPVRLELLDGPRGPLARLLELAAPAAERHATWRRAEQGRIAAGDRAAVEVLRTIGGTEGWPRLLALAQLDEAINHTLTWDDILRPHGWRPVTDPYTGTEQVDGEGRRVWSRPGSTRRSATTDWPPSPHTMTLFSTARETGLLRLLDTGVPLTKLRVHAELAYGGDLTALVRDLRGDA